MSDQISTLIIDAVRESRCIDECPPCRNDSPMRQTHRRILALACLLAPVVSGAQNDSRQWPPALVADSFFRATSAERWADAAHFVDVEAIGRLRDEQVRQYRQRSTPRQVTAETFLEFDPKMLREVGEYEAKRANDRSQDFDFLEYQFARITSVDTLAALPLREV